MVWLEENIGNCPGCGGRGVGRVGAGHYYCGDCCIEFGATARGWQLFQIDDEGDLVFWKEVGSGQPAPG